MKFETKGVSEMENAGDFSTKRQHQILSEKDTSEVENVENVKKSDGDIKRQKVDEDESTTSLKTDVKEPSVTYEISVSDSKCEKPESDVDGHIVASIGYVIADKYIMKSSLGEGTFGKVFLCQKIRSKFDEAYMKENVAIKIVRRVRKYYNSANVEIDVLRKLNKWDPNHEQALIYLLGDFHFHGHRCLVFPKMGPNLYEFMKANQFNPFTIKTIEVIALQVCKAVSFLHEYKLTHTDLKPENILFVSGEHELRTDRKGRSIKFIKNPTIKIIDFGSATFEHHHHTTVIATRHYRAPEVILELGWNMASDVWSVGCIFFELYTGYTLFQTHDNVEHLALMERVLGKIPRWMSRKTRKEKYFDHCGKLCWNPDSRNGKYVRANACPLLKYCSTDPKHVLLFDLIEPMLEYDPYRRITLKESIDDKFFNESESPVSDIGDTSLP